MSTVIYPGSFDPLTLGHLDIIRRAASIFDEVIVCVLHNSSKKTPLFSFDERVKMIQSVVENLPNVTVEGYQGLLVDFARSRGVRVIVRGLRELTDFDTEQQMAQGNRKVSGGVETVFLATDPAYSFISSTMVREFASYGKAPEGFVPPLVLDRIREKISREGKDESKWEEETKQEKNRI